MYKLNLPDFEYKLKKAEGKVWIFDVIRKKFVWLTPEEWVRQHMLNFLIVELQYPKSLMKVEGGLKYNTLHKRSDILVRDRNGLPWMLVECKSPSTKINRLALEQASAYNATHRAKYLVVSNGLTTVCTSINWNSEKTEVLSAFPPFD